MHRARLVVPSREALAALSEKYRDMLRLRRARARDVDAGSAHNPARAELQALAARHPGVLSEIDRLPMEQLEARAAEVEALLARDEVKDDELPLWVRGWIGVHRGLRGALTIKGWLHGRRTIDESTRFALEITLDSSPYGDDARAWLDALEVVASPPRGRLVDVVVARVAEELGVDADSLRATLWPPHARSS